VNARRRELFGLVLAGLIASVALATVTLARDAELSPDVVVWGALFLVLYVAAHVVVRRTVPYADGALLPLTAVLTAFGLTTIYRLDSDDGGRQAVWVAVGVGALAATLIWLRHDYRVLESYRYLFGVAAIALLLLPSVPGIGETVNGARLWVDLGVARERDGRERHARDETGEDEPEELAPPGVHRLMPQYSASAATASTSAMSASDASRPPDPGP